MTDLSVIRACYRSPKKDPAAMSTEVHSLFSSEIRDDCFSRFGVNVERYIPVDHDIRTNAQRIIQEVKDLPLSQFQYGLIHADVYQENMFLADGVLFLFDFDNCEYGHYISDIAIALYAALWRVPKRAARAEFSPKFFRSLFVCFRGRHHTFRTQK